MLTTMANKFLIGVLLGCLLTALTVAFRDHEQSQNDRIDRLETVIKLMLQR
jgi:hypothetical protein